MIARPRLSGTDRKKVDYQPDVNAAFKQLCRRTPGVPLPSLQPPTNDLYTVLVDWQIEEGKDESVSLSGLAD